MRRDIYYFIYIFQKRINNIIRTIFQSKKDISYISMFHNLVECSEGISDRYSCSVVDFENYIKAMLNNGIIFESIDNMINNFQCRGMTTVTFDDGFESVYTKAFPILIKYNIPFIIYVTGEFINKEGYLSSKQLFELSKCDLCEIGIHAYEHKVFRRVSSEELLNDYIKCKNYIESIIKKETKHYAFPYGSILAVSRANIETIKKCGVKSICLTTQRKLFKIDIKNRYYLPRLNIPALLDEMGLRRRKNTGNSLKIK